MSDLLITCVFLHSCNIGWLEKDRNFFNFDTNQERMFYDDFDDDMDGDLESGLSSAGWGIDESYEHYDEY